MADTNRYNRGKIYAIRSHQTKSVYIGSTCDTLTKRLSGHKCSFRRYIGCIATNYTSSYEILKYPDYYIELIEEYKCNNKMELAKKEGEIIRTTENCVNKIIAGRTYKEYREDNKEQYLEYHKQYREINKEKFVILQKKWYAKNKEKWLKDQKQYRAIKYTCECGTTLRNDSKYKHLKSKKHRELLTS